MSQIIQLEGSPRDQGGETPNPKLVVFTEPEFLIIRSVDHNGVVGPLRLVMRPGGSDTWFSIVQDLSPLELDKGEVAAMSDFISAMRSRAMLLGGKINIPLGDVSELSGAVEYLKKTKAPTE